MSLVKLFFRITNNQGGVPVKFFFRLSATTAVAVLCNDVPMSPAQEHHGSVATRAVVKYLTVSRKDQQMT